MSNTGEKTGQYINYLQFLRRPMSEGKVLYIIVIEFGYLCNWLG